MDEKYISQTDVEILYLLFRSVRRLAMPELSEHWWWCFCAFLYSK